MIGRCYPQSPDALDDALKISWYNGYPVEEEGGLMTPYLPAQAMDRLYNKQYATLPSLVTQKDFIRIVDYICMLMQSAYWGMLPLNEPTLAKSTPQREYMVLYRSSRLNQADCLDERTGNWL